LARFLARFAGVYHALARLAWAGRRFSRRNVHAVNQHRFVWFQRAWVPPSRGNQNQQTRQKCRPLPQTLAPWRPADPVCDLPSREICSLRQLVLMSALEPCSWRQAFLPEPMISLASLEQLCHEQALF